MKKVRVLLAIVCSVCVFLSVLLPVLFLPGENSVGIIGGADLPTYWLIYVRNGFVWLTFAGVLGLVVLFLVGVRRRFR